MIRLEDPAFEKAVFEQKSPIAVPAELNVGADGSLSILSFALTEDTARSFEDRHAEDPLAPDALRWLEETLLERLLPFGYDEVDTESCPLYDFRPGTLNRSAILPGCALIDTLDGERWDESLPMEEFSLDPKNPVDRMAVVRDGEGKIVCFAGLNDISAQEGLCELNVECAEPWRRMGYGVSCVVLLADYLDELGYGVQYVTSHLNEASVKLAEKAGFALAHTLYPVILRKSGEDDEEFFDFT